jgi:hypothetical protein
LAELSTRQIAETENARGIEENKKASVKGVRIAKIAKQELELETGKSVITGKNFLKEDNVKTLKLRNKRK